MFPPHHPEALAPLRHSCYTRLSWRHPGSVHKREAANPRECSRMSSECCPSPFGSTGPGHVVTRCFGALCSSHADRSSPIPLQLPAGWPRGPAGPNHDLQMPSLDLGPLQRQSSYPLPGCQNYLKQVPYACGFLEFGGLEEVVVRAGVPRHRGPKLSLVMGLGAGTGPQLIPACVAVSRAAARGAAVLRLALPAAEGPQALWAAARVTVTVTSGQLQPAGACD